MARNRKDDDMDFGYRDEPERQTQGKGSQTLFLVIVAVLLLALTVLCVMLTLRLRAANTEAESLRTQLSNKNQSVQWQDPVENTPVNTETVTIPTPGPALPETTPVPTPEPTPQPTPVPTPVVKADGLPAWLTEDNMARITRRPKDDEWYGSPGKLYVTATLGLNLRSGTRTDIDNIITQIKYGSEVMVYAASGNMRFVQDPKGNFGWVSNNLLSNEPPAGVEVIPFSPVQTPTPVSTPAPGVPKAEAPTING